MTGPVAPRLRLIAGGREANTLRDAKPSTSRLESRVMGAWEPIVAAFEVEQRSRGLSPATYRERGRVLRAFARSVGKLPADVTKLDLQVWLGRGIAASSMQRERADFVPFFRWAKSEGHVPKDPAKKLAPVRVPRGEPRPLTIEQIEAMLASGAYRKTRAMILLGYAMGLRAFEIAKIRGDDFDRISMQLLVLGKGGKERIVPVQPMIESLLDEFPASGYWFPGQRGREHVARNTVSDLMRRALDRAGITTHKRTGHSLRHSFATGLIAAGNDILVVQKLMRHDSVASTQIYAQVPETMRRRASDSLPEVRIPEASGRGTISQLEQRRAIAKRAAERRAA